MTKNIGFDILNAIGCAKYIELWEKVIVSEICKKSNRRATGVDVARLAGVHPGSVSRALTGKSVISEGVRKKIIEAARQLNYRPSMSASLLSKQRYETIGILAENESAESGYGSAFLHGVSHALNDIGYNLFLANIPPNSTLEEVKNVPSLKMAAMDGVILDLLSYKGDIEGLLSYVGIPYVFVNPPSPRPFNTVMPNDSIVAKRATELLINAGHKNIRYIPSIESNHSSQSNRIQGYLDAMNEAGLMSMSFFRIPHSGKMMGDFILPDSRAYAEFKDYILKYKGCTAFVVYSYIEAIWLVSTLYYMGIKIPDDISVISCDHSVELQFLLVPIDSIRLDRSRMGSIAVDLLLKRIKTGQDVPSVFIEGEYIKGNSIRKI